MIAAKNGDSVIVVHGSLKGETGVIDMNYSDGIKALVKFDHSVYSRENLSGHMVGGTFYWCDLGDLEMDTCKHTYPNACIRCGRERE